MSVIYILIPLALAIVAVAVWSFVWAAKRGQFDDMDTPAMRIVLEDDGAPSPSEAQESRDRAEAAQKSENHSENRA